MRRRLLMSNTPCRPLRHHQASVKSDLNPLNPKPPNPRDRETLNPQPPQPCVERAVQVADHRKYLRTVAPCLTPRKVGSWTWSLNLRACIPCLLPVGREDNELQTLNPQTLKPPILDFLSPEALNPQHSKPRDPSAAKKA